MLWRGSLLPLDCAAVARYWGCYASQRKQACSPQQARSYRNNHQRGFAMDHLVLTIIAADKPGLVERIAQNIAAHGANWLESRMAHMAGQFAGILRVSVPAQNRQALVGALEDLSTQGIRVLVGEGSSGQTAASNAIVMTLVGNDRSGIVREITALLSKQGVNLASLSTDVRPAPMSGDPLFTAEALLQVPTSLSLDTLQLSLETLADDLMVELHYEE